MNNTKFLLRFAMWTITLVLLDSCVADDNLVDRQQDNVARIEQINIVKQWYKRQTVTPVAKTRTVDDLLASQYHPSYSGEPSWDYFAVNKNDTMTVVDVDLTDRIGQDYVTEENLAAYRTTNNQNLRRSYTRLVYTKNHKTNKEQGFLMTIIPSKYYAKTYSNRVRKNTYLHRDKYLGGYVLFHNLDGKFANGWEYKKGKVIAKVRMPKSRIDAAGKKRLLLSYISASYLVKPRLHTPAQTRSGSEDDWYWDGGELPEVDIWGDDSTWLDEVVITPDPPQDDIEWPTDWPPVIEYPEDEWPDYGDPYDPDGGGIGGYEPPTPPTNPIVPPTIKPIYNPKSTLNRNELEQLELCFKDIIQSKAFRSMFDDLAKKEIQLSFKVVNDPVRIAYFDKANNSINFAGISNIQVNSLREEFIHAVQANLYYPDMSNSKRNYEFEAKVFLDIDCVRNSGVCPSIGIMGMEGNIGYCERYNELLEQFYDGEPWNESCTSIYEGLGKDWNQYPGVFDTNMKPQLLINYLK